jgi:tRNA 2-thiouridine synthesizing protein C
LSDTTYANNDELNGTSLALINKTAPYGRANGQESIDLALAAGSFGQNVSLFFIEDGVFQLLAKQTPELIEAKNYNKTFAALEFYDIENIYVCADSLATRNLLAEELSIEVRVLTHKQLQKRLNQHQHILSF